MRRDLPVTTVSVCSAKGSPGVTTLACALGAVWPAERRVMVAECDPSGGDIAARFGLSAKRGMTSLILEARRSGSKTALELEDHIQVVPGGLEVLAGPTGARASGTVDTELPECLVHLTMSGEDHGPPAVRDLVFDCGRIQLGAAGQAAAIGASHHVLVVARPTVEAVASTLWIAERLNQRRDPRGFLETDIGAAGLVLVGSGTVSPSQAAAALGLPLIAVVADDRAAASALRGEPLSSWRLARSALVDSVRELAAALLEPVDARERHEATHVSRSHAETPTRRERSIGRTFHLPFRASSRGRVVEADVDGASAFASSVPVTLAANEADL